MNWPRTIMDGIVMALLFNAVVGVGFLLYPQAYTAMFPKEIKEAAAPFIDKKEVRKYSEKNGHECKDPDSSYLISLPSLHLSLLCW